MVFGARLIGIEYRGLSLEFGDVTRRQCMHSRTGNDEVFVPIIRL